MKTLVAAALPLLAIAGIGSPAAASTVKVSYADLNLATVDGQAELQSRLKVAAQHSCRSVIDLRDLAGQAACKGAALGAVEHEVVVAIRNAGGERLAQRSAF